MSSLRVTQVLPVERVERLIHLARGEKVLLDADLAVLYGVATGVLNRAVKRNASRFPADFMFQLSPEETRILKCQIGISSFRHGGRRRSHPYAFTEQGVAMLSSVLRSERAVCRSTWPSCARSSACDGCWPTTAASLPSSPNWNADLKATTKPSNPFSVPFVNSWRRPPSRAARSASTPLPKRLTKVKPNPNTNENRRTGKTLLAQFPFQRSEESVQEIGALKGGGRNSPATIQP